MRITQKELNELKQQIIETKQQADAELQQLKNANERYQNGQQQLDELSRWHTEADELSNELTDWHKTAKSEFVSIRLLSQQAETDRPKIDGYKQELETMITLFKKQKQEIQDIIEDANRASMAGSFKAQADSINQKMKWADGLLIGSLLISVGISFWGFQTSFSETKQFLWEQFIAKAAISLPLLIIAWTKAKERAYLFRMREDYAYKYSSAMAFEGYKKQIQEQDPELQQQLLQIALNNLGKNPTAVFDKELQGTPLETIIEGVGKRFDQALGEKQPKDTDQTI